jgi:hypothetical protein
MQIELRGFKHAKFASEETNCFEAVVYIDGAKAGTVRNDGHGGSNAYQPHSLYERLKAYSETLPPRPLKLTPEKTVMIPQSPDILIGDLVNRELIARDYRRLIKTAVVFTKADGHAYTLRARKPFTVAEYIANRDKIPALRDAVQILNNMPEAEALAIYLEAGK